RTGSFRGAQAAIRLLGACGYPATVVRAVRVAERRFRNAALRPIADEAGSAAFVLRDQPTPEVEGARGARIRVLDDGPVRTTVRIGPAVRSRRCGLAGTVDTTEARSAIGRRGAAGPEALVAVSRPTSLA